MIPEKARLLEAADGLAPIPRFAYIPPEDFCNENFRALKAFLNSQNRPVIVRSAHLKESALKGGTFSSYGPVRRGLGRGFAGPSLENILERRDRIVRDMNWSSRLSILRQQKFNGAPEIRPDDLGIVVMEYVDGINIMAKQVDGAWEFGYSEDPRFVNSRYSDPQPLLTSEAHDPQLIELSENIQDHFGFPCEIEYVLTPRDNGLHLVQVRDISTFSFGIEPETSIPNTLPGRIEARADSMRQPADYRERPVFYVNDSKWDVPYMRHPTFWKELSGKERKKIQFMCAEVLDGIRQELEEFALEHEHYAVVNTEYEHPTHEMVRRMRWYDWGKEKLSSQGISPDQDRNDVESCFTGELYLPFCLEADTLVIPQRAKASYDNHKAFGISDSTIPFVVLQLEYDWQRPFHSAEFCAKNFPTGSRLGVLFDKDREEATLHRVG